jgi:hypothetical protein
VKAVDRKIEALLLSADPGIVVGDALFVIASYPFHVSKLNDPRVRSIVEDAVEKVTGRRLRASFVLKDDLPGAPAVAESPSAPSWSGPRPSEPPPFSPPNGLQEDEPFFDEDTPLADDDFTRNVKAIMDAEEVHDPDEIAQIP